VFVGFLRFHWSTFNDPKTKVKLSTPFLKNQLGKEAVRQRFSLLELFNTKKQLTLYTGAELGLFIRGSQN
jgi:hypothetical protein